MRFTFWPHFKDGTTALFLATQSGFADLVTLLISEARRRGRDVGILVAAPREDGASPLFIAAQMGHVECVKVLLEADAEVDQSRIDDATPLFKACHKGHLEIVEELIKYKANSGVLANGESCLHAAALSGSKAVVEALLNQGDDRCIKNWSGLTARDLALAAGYDNLSELLKPKTKVLLRPSTLKTSASSHSQSSSSSSTSSPKQQHVRFAEPLAEEDSSLAVTRVQCRERDDPSLAAKSTPVKVSWRPTTNSTLPLNDESQAGRTH